MDPNFAVQPRLGNPYQSVAFIIRIVTIVLGIISLTLAGRQLKENYPPEFENEIVKNVYHYNEEGELYYVFILSLAFVLSLIFVGIWVCVQARRESIVFTHADFIFHMAFGVFTCIGAIFWMVSLIEYKLVPDDVRLEENIAEGSYYKNTTIAFVTIQNGETKRGDRQMDTRHISDDYYLERAIAGVIGLLNSMVYFGLGVLLFVKALRDEGIATAARIHLQPTEPSSPVGHYTPYPGQSYDPSQQTVSIRTNPSSPAPQM